MSSYWKKRETELPPPALPPPQPMLGEVHVRNVAKFPPLHTSGFVFELGMAQSVLFP